MPWIPRVPDVRDGVVVAEAKLGSKAVVVFTVPDQEHLPAVPVTKEVKMAEETPALPDPADVEATYNAMRDSVLAAYAEHDSDAADAREMLTHAEAQQQGLRERYPMFFPAEEGRNRSLMSQPGLDVKNLMLRTLADHPQQTLKQLSRRVGWSRSWCGRVLQVIMEEHVTQQGALIERDRKGREFQYHLTAAGRALVGRGGIQTEGSAS